VHVFDTLLEHHRKSDLVRTEARGRVFLQNPAGALPARFLNECLLCQHNFTSKLDKLFSTTSMLPSFCPPFALHTQNVHPPSPSCLTSIYKLSDLHGHPVRSISVILNYPY
jgi:hypothetical protein